MSQQPIVVGVQRCEMGRPTYPMLNVCLVNLKVMVLKQHIGQIEWKALSSTELYFDVNPTSNP